MLFQASNLFDLTLQATDGEIGSVHDLYFDDLKWRVRYVVVDTGNWLSGRRVLLTREPLGTPNWTKGVLPVNLTQSAIKNSPPEITSRPISRQDEIDLHKYYDWTPYWLSVNYASQEAYVAPTRSRPAPVHRPAAKETAAPAAAAQKEAEIAGQQEKVVKVEPVAHLRSMREVMGYHIQAIDGEIGHVETFLLNDANWHMQYLVVDTRNWLPGRKVPLSLSWVTDVDWPDGEVTIDLHRDTIQNCPEIDLDQPISEQHEAALTAHYEQNAE